jgi:hypothetical protein
MKQYGVSGAINNEELEFAEYFGRDRGNEIYKKSNW